MNSLNMAAISPYSAPRGSDKSTDLEKADDRLSPRIRSALTVLFEAFGYAQDLGASPWDFATEISSLRRLKLSNSDLRWLVGRQFVEHGIEVTLSSDEERSFQHPSRLMFTRRTCFVLSPAGAALACQVARVNEVPPLAEALLATEPPALAIASPPPLHPPKWDRDRQELRVGSTVVRQFKVPSLDEETILAAFEELHWAPRIDDPLQRCDEPSAKAHLQEAVALLNRNQRQHLVRFRTDGTGCGILWEFSTASSAPRETR